MVFLTRHKESIKAILWFAFVEYLQDLLTTFTNNHYNLLQPLNLFENLLLLLLLPLSKAFKSFLVFQTLKTKCAIHLFHSLLPLPKRIRQGLTTWILFVSLFSLFQKNKGLTAWIILCLPSPLSKNSKWHSLRILLILPIP